MTNEKLQRKQKWADNQHSKRIEKKKRIRKAEAAKGNTVPKPTQKPEKHSSQSSWMNPSLSTIVPLIAKGAALTNFDASVLLDRLESLFLMGVALRDVQTASAVAAIVAQTLKNLTKNSLSVDIAQNLLPYVIETFGFNIFSSQAGELDSSCDWLLSLKNVQNNWMQIRDFPGFQKVSHLISMAAAIGLCDLASFKCDVNGVRLFSVGAHQKHVRASDFVTAIIDTVVYFVEGAYKSFQTGSLKAFLFTSTAAQDFDIDYHDAIEAFSHAKAHNLSRQPVKVRGVEKILTDNDFSCMLDTAIDRVTEIMSSTHNSWERNVLNNKAVILRKMRADWQTLRVNGDLREAPMGVYIFGRSGVGKSTLAALIMRVILKSANADYSDNRIISVKESDKFDSNIKSHINGYFIDDLGNTKADFVEKSPCEKIIDIMNNMPTYANMAEADLKGKVTIAPKSVVGTSNVRLADLARKYSNEPFSIVRRMQIHVEARVKKEFCKSSENPMLDSEKVFAAFGDDPVPDVWDLEVSFPLESATTTMLQCHCQHMSIHQLLALVVQKTKSHFAWQEKLVNINQNLGDKLNFCSECCLPASTCTCIRDMVPPPPPPPEPEKAVLWNLDGKETVLLSEVDHNMYYLEEKVGEYLPRMAPMAESLPPDHYMHEAYAALSKQADWDFEFDDGIPELDEERRLMRVDRDASPAGSLVSSLSDEREPLWDVFKGNVSAAAQHSYETTVGQMVDYLASLDQRNWALIHYVPDFIVESSLFRWMYFIRRHRDFLAYERQLRMMCYFWTLFVFLVPLTHFPSLYIVLFLYSTLFPMIVTYVVLLLLWKRRCEMQLARTRGFTPVLFERLRQMDIRRVCAASVFIAGVYYVARTYRKTMALLQQSKLEPENAEEIAARDKEENPWAAAAVHELHVSDRCKTTTFERLIAKATKSLCSVVMVEDGKRSKCNAFFLKSNVCVLPAHIMKSVRACRATFIKYDNHKTGASFNAPLTLKNVVFVPQTDFCLCYVPSGGSWPDLTHFLPEDLLPSSSGQLVFRDLDGSLKESKLYATSQKVTTDAGTFHGHVYDLSFTTFNGLCGAFVVSNTRYPTLAGFHIGGRNGASRGCCGTLTRTFVEQSLQALSKVPGLLLSANNGTMPKEKYDIQFFQSTDVHPRSPVNFLEPGTNFSYFGQINGRSDFTSSEVVPTKISPIVEEVTGVPRGHGPPKFHRWKNWVDSLKHSSKPSPGIEMDLVSDAVQDYIEPLLDIMKNPDLPWQDEVRPLTDMQTVVGIDGKRFVDKMPPTTSVGYPINKKKKDFLTYLDPLDFPEFSCPAELDPMFIEEAARMEEKYLQGERAYPIFKACLKDEPTKIGKEKVRVFQAAELAGQFLVRKYFLPIARFLCMNPIVSECAVGLNSHGPEWQELMDHITKYGEENILAGDYSKYDLRMPAQVTSASFWVYIALAEASGNYSERDLKIMSGIATDNVYPLSAYNGDLIMFNGTVPSGTPLTVFVNNTGNSIKHRCGFFSLCDKNDVRRPKYREAAASMFYGDDADSSVNQKYKFFNHIAYAAWLKERDIVFTMPDKESEPVEFMHHRDVDFLKRKNVFIPELDRCFGALDEDSIFKMLHAVLRSQAISPEDQAAQNIDTALREWFYHGREVYESRRAQMIEVAEKSEVDHICRELNHDFDERVMMYKEKYCKTSPDPSGV